MPVNIDEKKSKYLTKSSSVTDLSVAFFIFEVKKVEI